MDRINEYRQIIFKVLSNFVYEYDKNGQLIFDVNRDRYLVMHNEWQDESRLYGCAMQLDIIDGQIWIQHNSTEIYIDRELIQQGVAPQDVILGFRSPSIRKLLAARN
jgi:XisI protein